MLVLTLCGQLGKNCREKEEMAWRRREYSPYFTWHISPTTISPTGIWATSPPRITANLCSCSILLWSPRNCFSFLQSLKAVTKTTTKTATRMATPSIHPASDSVSSPPPANDVSVQEQHAMYFSAQMQTVKKFFFIVLCTQYLIH